MYPNKYDFDKNTESDVISGCPNGWMEFRAKKNTCYKTVWETDPRAATDRIDLIRRNERSQWGRIIIQVAFESFNPYNFSSLLLHSDKNKYLVNRVCISWYKNWNATSKMFQPHCGNVVRLVERKRKWNNNFNDLRGVKNSRFLSPLLYYVPLKNKVMRVGSDTFWDLFIQKILQNWPSSRIISVLRCFA